MHSSCYAKGRWKKKPICSKSALMYLSRYQNCAVFKSVIYQFFSVLWFPLRPGHTSNFTWEELNWAKVVREKISLKLRRSQEILFWILRENFEEKSEKIETDKLGLEEAFGVTVISMIFFLNEEEKFVENLSVLNERVERTPCRL